jgi:serine/threonine-protein kinase RsbW
LKEHVSAHSVFDCAMKRRKLEFSSHAGNLALMRNFVRHFLDNFPLSERDRTLMVLGVDEACTNIIRHAYGLRDDQLIALSCEGRADCVRLRLRDYGEQPTPESLREHHRDGVRPGGFGLIMIRHAFDKIDYIFRQHGTELVLTKKLG